MFVTIIADKYKGRRGYKGAPLELPAGRFSMEDALERARVPEGGDYELHQFRGWPYFLRTYLKLCESKTLEEVNFLAHKLQGMDDAKLAAYEGILRLKEGADRTHPVSMQEDMLDVIRDLPDEVYELLDEEKTGVLKRRIDQGMFTGKGYVFGTLEDWREVYDGMHLPRAAGEHGGILALRLETAEEDTGRKVWLELPAEEEAMQEALRILGEETFDNCVIKETKSILPSLEYQLAGDEDIRKLNLLAERIQAFPDKRTLVKYKAILERELCNDLDMELDIAGNLPCYEYDAVILSAADYGEYILEEAGIDTKDPAFSSFDFEGYGERQLSRSGFVETPYGLIGRNEQPFLPEYTQTEPGLSMQ
ncbi:antirestriction protein ArdA [Eisenbergiella tayi]|uniref:antirestriction protein ArdA n=1 Tax=Eisenbergiella tayi TaxID=1432052 RepID=UPI0008496C35|nr:antirestriction protein ArdA [Eisenbergiella tayi]ODR28348.1 hypothetical protein BEI60_31500 [Eisenbergiella tayi]